MGSNRRKPVRSNGIKRESAEPIDELMSDQNDTPNMHINNNIHNNNNKSNNNNIINNQHNPVISGGLNEQEFEPDDTDEFLEEYEVRCSCSVIMF